MTNTDKTPKNISKGDTNKKEKEEIRDEVTERVDSAKERFSDISETGAESGFWDEARDNISEGARAFSSEAGEFGERVANYSEKIFGRIKEVTQSAWSRGTELTREAVESAQEMAEKYRDRNEINKLNDQKKKAASQLGMQIYLEYKNHDNHLPTTTTGKKDIKNLLNLLQELDKEILKYSEEKKD